MGPWTKSRPLQIMSSEALVETDEGSKFEKKVQKAIEELSQGERPIAIETSRCLKAGRAKILSLTDLTVSDYRQVLKFWKDQGEKLNFTASDYPQLKVKKSPLQKYLLRALDGFMWDDRIYLHPDVSSRGLASTLVHEFNHVINKSHLHYATDEESFTEEYRAFAMEEELAGRDWRAHAAAMNLKKRVAKDYNLKRLKLESLPDVPRGILVPNCEE